jgi:hypothetical protein
MNAKEEEWEEEEGKTFFPVINLVVFDLRNYMHVLHFFFLVVFRASCLLGLLGLLGLLSLLGRRSTT